MPRFEVPRFGAALRDRGAALPRVPYEEGTRMYRIIASDLDETLLSSDTHVCQRNVEAIHAARAKGAHFVPCTGRPFDSVGGTLEELGLAGAAGEYVISFNGGAVNEISKPEPLCLRDLDFDLADDLYRRGVAYGMCMHLYTVHDVWVYGLNDDERAYAGPRMTLTETHEPTLDFLRGQTVMKILYEDTDMNHLRGIHQELAPYLDDVFVTYSSNRYLEFCPKGVDKGSGLHWLADYLGVPYGETIGIGDSLNDLAMVEDSGLGCVVANAVGEIRDAADYICEATNDQGGVGEVIERFVLSFERGDVL